MIKIVTDSTCDLPDEIIEKHDITVVPLYINVGEKSYLDKVELSRDDFYKNLSSYTPHPTTATPGINVFKNIYERLLSSGATHILSIHISKSLSATLEVAKSAAQEIKNKKIIVLDSKQISMGTGLLVRKTAEAIQSGISIDNLLSAIEEQIKKTHVFAALDTLEYLRRSGRMNGAIAGIGSLLQVKPILKMYDGVPESEKVRTRDRAIQRIKEMLIKLTPLEEVALVHAQAIREGKRILEEVKDFLPSKHIDVVEITPVIGAHLGPGALGFACITANKERVRL